MRARCVSGLSGTARHEPDGGLNSAALTRRNSTTRQRRALPGKDSIPLLKRVSQVRNPAGAQRTIALTWGLSPRGLLFGLGRVVRCRLRERTES